MLFPQPSFEREGESQVTRKTEAVIRSEADTHRRAYQAVREIIRNRNRKAYLPTKE